MDALRTQLEEAAVAHDFSGVVGVWSDGHLVVGFARGFADRANARPNKVTTRFAVASATKGLTALTIMKLVESGALSLDTTVRSVVGDRLAQVDPAVTIDHLLTHRSGVGDYLDEETLGDIDDHVLGALSAHILQSPGDYGSLLNRHPQRSAPGEQFAYNNSGYVMLSLIIEQITGSFHQACADLVLRPAVMSRSGFFRADQLPAESALGYLKSGRTNVFHLPVIGAGDGGVYLTLNDAFRLWNALFAGHILTQDSVERMTVIVSANGDKPSYGRGFWLDQRADHVWLEGMDAGVSFQSGVVRSSGVTYAALSNTSTGVWPLAKLIVAAASPNPN